MAIPIVIKKGAKLGELDAEWVCFQGFTGMFF